MTSSELHWDEISVPFDLPEVVDEISYQRVVENAGATWDYFPGHFDPGYARDQGTPRAPALLISRLVSWVDDLWCRAIGAGV
ncbi:hypothetical protein [Mycobacterium ulcerans]|uniref:hypothetical protein n=1 Tax=Mycobacterium ulcerans TaxID=1809 RepID=UPI000BBADFF3|nr:hypothetical protein [Mycobacterium ulcerans]